MAETLADRCALVKQPDKQGFYYDVLRLPDGRSMRLKVRSIVGLLPVCAVTVIEPSERERLPNLVRTFMERLRRMPDLLDTIHATGPGHFGVGERGIGRSAGAP